MNKKTTPTSPKSEIVSIAQSIENLNAERAELLTERQRAYDLRDKTNAIINDIAMKLEDVVIGLDRQTSAMHKVVGTLALGKGTTENIRDFFSPSIRTH